MRKSSQRRSVTAVNQSVPDVDKPQQSECVAQTLRLVRLFRGHLAIILGVALLVAGWVPQLAPTSAYGFDKFVHIVAFGAFAYLMTLLFKQTLFVALAVSAFSGLIEFGQGFVPGRLASWHDFFANILGILFAVGLAQVLSSVKCKRRLL